MGTYDLAGLRTDMVRHDIHSVTTLTLVDATYKDSGGTVVPSWHCYNDRGRLIFVVSGHAEAFRKARSTLRYAQWYRESWRGMTLDNSWGVGKRDYRTAERNALYATPAGQQ